ncbi:MAG: type II toxin-antitoxin system VapC family toxin [Nakamurella sp.]
MSCWYLDTSAALKLLVDESESSALAHAIESHQPEALACYLLETELRRAALRYPSLTQDDVRTLLDGVSLYAVPPSLFRQAGLLPGENLRSLDALHLSAALRLGVDEFVTYDTRMIVAARAVGMSVLSPGLA